MNELTPVWVGNPGNAGYTAISGIIDKGYKLVIETRHLEF
jgi:hypothetical protein